MPPANAGPSFLRGLLGELEDLGKPCRGLDLLGEHAPGLGPVAGRRDEPDDFLDAGQPFEEFAHAVACVGMLGFAALQVDGLQDQEAGGVWVWMLCSVQWCKGENETKCRFLSCRTVTRRSG
ncbi:hypothetical protein DQ353_17465 [Arthrobacter sp. AQ5-05]|uniref:hypothetical protein n=1 Tax=Arthrobacter sp. AQ5-05 TaxID=2184581 RepID=UPI000DCC1D63|nr:hypothetical protein [Arthrobacter sp. AQ5-05]RAX47982.1 hypothetical protein DQ353_17465 [Arthrobacter sp. AQ5-05]